MTASRRFGGVRSFCGATFGGKEGSKPRLGAKSKIGGKVLLAIAGVSKWIFQEIEEVRRPDRP
jgi:hypothetical protein